MEAPNPRSKYKIGVICALPHERTAVESILDAHHVPLPAVANDVNTYSFGSVGLHNVVVASLGSGSYGTVSAAEVANDIRHSFPAIKLGFMVGIASAAPQPFAKNGDVRLGNVVVGCVNGVPSVVHFGSGKETAAGFDVRSELAEPPAAIQRAVSALQSKHQQEGPTYLNHLQLMLKRNPRLDRPQIAKDYYNLPDTSDVLFATTAIHDPGREDCVLCRQEEDAVISRRPRFLRDPPDNIGDVKFVRYRQDGFADYPQVHYGTIASSDVLMKNGTERDLVVQRVKAQRKADVLCFEMEAAGIVKNWPCLIIRGICDYSDSHKNDAWQNFAAATAAAYTKDLLLRIPAESVDTAPRVGEVMNHCDGQDHEQNARTSARSSQADFGVTNQYNLSQYRGSNNKQYNAGYIMFGSDDH
ncbi:hypothetical protein CKM354_001298400 [Cercospora kikuchii]|uniref:Nucleoside phosphorylase domain-containing protein n=1 Tax=Cercospora kikuchii TaxID=84275 RepID=A0A9P3FN01_9PEZI|nr:uncharacterized protein CKM354_001298400 [Cercospora kikuchii]GIZ49968.1 hypothetical protein CKM354_001298400 [Cercospora kikuchii]